MSISIFFLNLKINKHIYLVVINIAVFNLKKMDYGDKVYFSF